ncbi:hypothetical protein EDD16DRAFT_1705227 [Pisolithus croceorrhizus]|nr:hypothetical protein EDD16DRAFT_1705227 [Pisolithus croceorrhizus]KAI6169039.1 hypothetical protein EDD17DRAFT_1749492 [Pisolithus thermaeus]
MDPPVPQSYPVASSRWLTCVTAGQGGHVIQLERAGLAIEVHRQLPKPLHQIPEDEPVNDMALAPHQTKKATHKVTRESKNGGLSIPPNNVPSDQSSQLPVSQDDRFSLQLENPAAPTYVGLQTIDTYERGSTNNSTLSYTKKVTQLTPTAHPQSGWSHATIQTPQGLPMAAPSCPQAYKTHTFCSEIKKAAIRFIPAQYQLLPPPSATTEADHHRAIKIRAEEILKGGPYLQGEVDAQGKTSNFAHDALKNVCLAVYCSSSVESLCQFTKFQQYVLYKVLLLVTAIIHEVLCIYKMHRFIPKESKLSSKALNSAFNTMAPKLEAVLSHAYHGPKLNAMLEEWANIGMMGYTPNGCPAVAQDSNHFGIILD